MATRPTPVTPTSGGPPTFGSSASFTAPLPPPAASSASVNSHPFSAESLLTNKREFHDFFFCFLSVIFNAIRSRTTAADQTDLLRRELDSRFLDRSGLSAPASSQGLSAPSPGNSSSSASRPSTQATPPASANSSSSTPANPQSTTPTSQQQQQQPSNIPFLRQELHHHQHQHTHLHQHQHQHQALMPTTPSASIFPPPLFKDIPKIGAVDSPFYRTAPLMGMPPYPYPSGILHPGLSGPTQFVPPSHLQSFVPKVSWGEREQTEGGIDFITN
jgi:hypothetical protein